MEIDPVSEMCTESSLPCDSNGLSAKILKSESETAEESEDTIGSGNQEISGPILQKIIGLSNSIKALKEEHVSVSNQMEEIKKCSFSEPEMSNALQLLSTELQTIKMRYLQESSERKRLYNEVIELKGNIRVFCRCRPLNQAEIENGAASVVEFDPTQENELQIHSTDSSKKQFKFDHVFKPEDGQDTVFAQTKPIVTSVLDGYNVCIFAYGQTGTGKTFTMEGTPDNRGVNYRTLEELFRSSESRSHLMKFDLFVSMVEVYNEKIRDLLVENSNQPTKKLEVKQSAEGTQEVPGLIESQVYSTNEVWELLKTGYRARSVGSTAANELSSRSHCLLRVTVKGENLVNGQRTKSHLWLVDLAGSERVGKIEVEGERLKESQFINKSLSALGDVISALASKTSHIPYRNSKLTHMLQNSLGGDCKTLMFVQISPSNSDFGETLCSLNFASRVRGIETGPARKQGDASELLKYKQMAEKLKHDDKETKKLQDNVQSLQLRLTAREHLCKGLQDKVRDLESQLAEERKTRIKQENRALATAASSSTSRQQQPTEKLLPTIIENTKPPLAPTRTRVPLRRITNFLPPPSPVVFKKHGKEHEPTLRPSSSSSASSMNLVKAVMKPRSSIAALPPPSGKTFQPRRRASIATVRPEEPSSQQQQKQSYRRGSRKARYSNLFDSSSSSDYHHNLTTPNNNNNNSSNSTLMKMKKPVVWSPLNLKSFKARRPSFVAIRAASASASSSSSVTSKTTEAADLLRRQH